MIILDEDIMAPERERLRLWRIHFRRIGVGVGRLGMKDRSEILPLLHILHRPTFFMRDHGLYHPTLRHPRYCLVYLGVHVTKVADYIRRFLRHTDFHTQAQRMGRVVRVRHSGISYWQVDKENEHMVGW